MKTRSMEWNGVFGRVEMAFRVVILAVILGVSVAAAQARTVVRGRIERQAPNGHRYPVTNMAVTIEDSATARRWRPTYTGRDGLFYLNGVPEGTYYLELTVSHKRAPLRFLIRATRKPYTDIPPIVLE